MALRLAFRIVRTSTRPSLPRQLSRLVTLVAFIYTNGMCELPSIYNFTKLIRISLDKIYSIMLTLSNVLIGSDLILTLTNHRHECKHRASLCTWLRARNRASCPIFTGSSAGMMRGFHHPSQSEESSTILPSLPQPCQLKIIYPNCTNSGQLEGGEFFFVPQTGAPQLQ